MSRYLWVGVVLLCAACADIPARSPAGAYLQAKGVGRPDPASQTETQRKATSRDAAIADARNHLRSQLEALPAGKDKAAEIERLTLSAEPASTRWEGDIATVMLRLDKARAAQTLGGDSH